MRLVVLQSKSEVDFILFFSTEEVASATQWIVIGGMVLCVCVWETSLIKTGRAESLLLVVFLVP